MSVQNNSFQTNKRNGTKEDHLKFVTLNRTLFSPFARKPNGQNVLVLYHPENKSPVLRPYPNQHILPGTLAVSHVIRGVGNSNRSMATITSVITELMGSLVVYGRLAHHRENGSLATRKSNPRPYAPKYTCFNG